MGRYVHGSAGFSYKYVFAAQATNLSQLPRWSGIEQPETNFSLHAQFLLPQTEANDARHELVSGVGPLTTCYQGPLPPFDLVDDVESAIYQVCDRWRSVIRGIDAYLPGPVLRPDIGGGASFVLTRADWPRLAARIGQGMDLDTPASFGPAIERLFESGADDYLPYMAARALAHAVEHDLDRFEMVDTEPRQTNLWDVAEDYAGPYDPDAPWEERALRARLMSFQRKGSEAERLFRALLRERPSAIPSIRALFAIYVWNEDWMGIHTFAGELLEASDDDSARAELLRWRGEAAWSLGRLDEAEVDAEAAAFLGRTELRDALAQSGEDEDEDAFD